MSTLITQKYNYTALDRKTGKTDRVYVTPDGNPVPSVTTILSKTKDNTFLVEWRKRVGTKKAAEITAEASGVGTRMHKYIEDYIETGEWRKPGGNPYSVQAHDMACVIKEKALSKIDEYWGSEVHLYMPQMYAGTADLIASVEGVPAICDFKQTNKPKKGEWVEDYYLQMVAYALCHNELYGTDIKHGHIFMCSRGLEYQQFTLSPEPDPYFNRTFDQWAHAWWDRLHEYYEKSIA